MFNIGGENWRKGGRDIGIEIVFGVIRVRERLGFGVRRGGGGISFIGGIGVIGGMGIISVIGIIDGMGSKEYGWYRDYIIYSHCENLHPRTFLIQTYGLCRFVGIYLR